MNMKLNSILLFFAIFSVQLAISQTSLEVTFKRCNNNEGFNQWQYFKIYNEKDTIRLDGSHYDSTFILNVLRPGSYKFTYETVMNSTITKRIEIVKNQNNNLEICVDKLKSYEQQDSLLIDLLRDDEHFTIHFRSEGCFHRTNNILQISKVNSHYFVQVDGHKERISYSQLELLREFEIELKIIPDQWCTTIEYYTLEYANKKYRYKDNACNWHGFYYLLKNLGVNKKKNR